MAVLQMQKFSICALKKNRKEVLELLQAAGVVEVTQEAEEDGVFRKTDTVSSTGMRPLRIRLLRYCRNMFLRRAACFPRWRERL